MFEGNVLIHADDPATCVCCDAEPPCNELCMELTGYYLGDGSVLGPNGGGKSPQLEAVLVAPPGQICVGDIITLTLTVYNLSGITQTSAMNSGPASIDTGGGVTATKGTCTGDDPDYSIPAGESITFSCPFTITAIDCEFVTINFFGYAGQDAGHHASFECQICSSSSG